MDHPPAQTPPMEQPEIRRDSQPRSQARHNRLSLKSQGASISTDSPVSPDFPPEAGLAPRPSSFPYGAPDPEPRASDNVKANGRTDTSENRQSRRLSLDKPLPPVPPSAAEAPRGQPPLSYRDPHRSATRSMAQSSSSSRSRNRDSFSERSNGRPQRNSSTRASDPDSARRVFVNGKSFSTQPQIHDATVGSDTSKGANIARRDSTGEQRRREWAPDRSPLQKLELTLHDISKEEKRAQVEEAQLLERDARAGRSSRSRRAGHTSELSNPSYSQSNNEHLAEVGLVRNLSHKQKDRLQRSATVDSKKPSATSPTYAEGRGDFEYQEQEYIAPDSREPSRKLAHKRQMSRSAQQPVSMPMDEGDRARDLDSQSPPSAQPPNRAATLSDERNTARGIPNPGQLSKSTTGVKYSKPPQTASAIEARKQVGTGPDTVASAEKKHLSDYLHLHHKGKPPTQPRVTQPVLEEWRQENVLRLTKADLRNEPPPAAAPVNVDQKAWWEQDPRKRSAQYTQPALADGATDQADKRNVEDVPTAFSPKLYLKCGPLLRSTGLTTGPTPTWRGTVMIVTTDSASSYKVPPTLRLYAEQKDLLPPPPPQVGGEKGELPPEYVDPIAGLPKMTRTGGTVYVKPVEHLDESKDLSTIEDDAGLFQSSLSDLDHHSQRDHQLVGKAGKSREVPAIRLHAERGVTFWRFKLEIELTEKQTRVAYRINNGPAIGFWIPARGTNMNLMFHSCNGFSQSVNPDEFSGPDPMWRDVLNNHQTSPFHAMIGGGDQLYCDKVSRTCSIFEEWLNIKNPVHKHDTEFGHEIQDELEQFYLDNYSGWFSQGLFGMAASQIPMINIWDDHDIIDGFGSYPHHFMSSPVFTGLGAIAFKYYMLFQHHSVPAEAETDEPSWLLGAARGPYINELSRSVFLHLGPNVAFLGLDCRTERMRDEILSEDTYDLIFDRCDKEIIAGQTKHLIVLLGVPIAYPRLVFLEQILTSRLMDPVKALGRTGILGGFLNKFDGGVEILDDLDDHWTAKNHKSERNWLLQELQELAAAKSVRITILSGDVHLAAVGRFYTNPKLRVPKDQDHRYMYNVISSAIVNTPPPEMMGDILNKRNKIHHLDKETDEDMVPLFTHDVDGKSRNNKRLLPRRNWCSIKEYYHGNTPPPTPPSPSIASEDMPPSPSQMMPPGRLTRTLSMTRASASDSLPGRLVRRLSNRGGRRPPLSYLNASSGGRDSAVGSTSTDFAQAPRAPGATASTDNYFSPNSSVSTQQRPDANGRPSMSGGLPGGRTPFHRQPTDLGKTRAGRRLAKEDAGHVNFEHGLEIVLNLEVSQSDPAGITTPYRLLVPALWYAGEGDENPLTLPKSKRRSTLMRLPSVFKGGSRRGSVMKAAPAERGTESELDEEERFYDGAEPHGNEGQI